MRRERTSVTLLCDRSEALETLVSPNRDGGHEATNTEKRGLILLGIGVQSLDLIMLPALDCRLSALQYAVPNY